LLIERFFPDIIYDGIYEIDLDALQARGVMGLILDVDNTLVEPRARQPDALLLKWLDDARARGFDIAILSNSGRKRVSLFSSNLGVYAISGAAKPSARGFAEAMRVMGLESPQVCMIGDQIFTDVYGAARLGIYTVYVKPIRLREIVTVMLKRVPERIVLHYFCKEHGQRRTRNDGD
jgi:HAD superfamily phosphatase (TIGR01668 family)